jgi:hypothetical protein
MSATPQERFGGLSLVEWHRMPLRERVTDRLADLMFDADDILQMLGAHGAVHDFSLLETDLRRIYDSVNIMMKSLCD